MHQNNVKVLTSRVLPLSNAAGNFTDQATASFVRSMLGFHTRQTDHCSCHCNKNFGCLLTVMSGFLGLRFNCVVRSWAVSAARSFALRLCHLHPPCLAQPMFSSLRNVLSSSHNGDNQGFCRRFQECVVRSTFFLIAQLSTPHEGVPIRILHPRCQEWSSWDFMDHQHRFSGILRLSTLAQDLASKLDVSMHIVASCPQTLLWSMGVPVCASSASWFRRKKLLQIAPPLLRTPCLGKCLFYGSSVTLDVETVEYPRTVAYLQAHQAMICSVVNFVFVSQQCSLCSKLSLYGQLCSLTSPKTALRSSWCRALHQCCFAWARQHTWNFCRRRFSDTLQLG